MTSLPHSRMIRPRIRSRYMSSHLPEPTDMSMSATSLHPDRVMSIHTTCPRPMYSVTDEQSHADTTAQV